MSGKPGHLCWHFEGVANWDTANTVDTPMWGTLSGVFFNGHPASGDNVEIEPFHIGDGTGADGIFTNSHRYHSNDISRWDGLWNCHGGDAACNWACTARLVD